MLGHYLGLPSYTDLVWQWKRYVILTSEGECGNSHDCLCLFFRFLTNTHTFVDEASTGFIFIFSAMFFSFFSFLQSTKQNKLASCVLVCMSDLRLTLVKSSLTSEEKGAKQYEASFHSQPAKPLRVCLRKYRWCIMSFTERARDRERDRERGRYFTTQSLSAQLYCNILISMPSYLLNCGSDIDKHLRYKQKWLCLMLQQWNWSDINVIEEDKIEKMYTTYYKKKC